MGPEKLTKRQWYILTISFMVIAIIIGYCTFASAWTAFQVIAALVAGINMGWLIHRIYLDYIGRDEEGDVL